MTTERKWRGRPRNPDADRVILMSTLRLLAERGYGAMSVAGVAAAAGVGKTTLYRRYKDKRELVVATLSMLRQELPPLPDTGDVKQDLLSAANDILRYLQSMNGFAIVGGLFAQAGQNPEFLALFQEHIFLPRRALLKSLLERSIQRGQLRGDVDLEAVADCISGSFFARHVSGLPKDERWIQSVMKVVLDGIVQARGCSKQQRA